mgnify:CR=1 FL=1
MWLHYNKFVNKSKIMEEIMNLKICFLAPSGYGKSTASKFIESEFNAKVIKIGKPLYDLQSASIVPKLSTS